MFMDIGDTRYHKISKPFSIKLMFNDFNCSPKPKFHKLSNLDALSITRNLLSFPSLGLSDRDRLRPNRGMMAPESNRIRKGSSRRVRWRRSGKYPSSKSFLMVTVSYFIASTTRSDTPGRGCKLPKIEYPRSFPKSLNNLIVVKGQDDRCTSAGRDVAVKVSITLVWNSWRLGSVREQRNAAVWRGYRDIQLMPSIFSPRWIIGGIEKTVMVRLDTIWQCVMCVASWKSCVISSELKSVTLAEVRWFHEICSDWKAAPDISIFSALTGYRNNGPDWSITPPKNFPQIIRSFFRSWHWKLLGRQALNIHGISRDSECHLLEHWLIASITALNCSFEPPLSRRTIWRGKDRERRIQSFTEPIRLNAPDVDSSSCPSTMCIVVHSDGFDHTTSRHPLQTEPKYEGITDNSVWENSPQVEGVRICSFWVRLGVGVWESHERDFAPNEGRSVCRLTASRLLYLEIKLCLMATHKRPSVYALRSLFPLLVRWMNQPKC